MATWRNTKEVKKERNAEFEGKEREREERDSVSFTLSKCTKIAKLNFDFCLFI